MAAPYPTPASDLYEITLEVIRASNNKDWDKLSSLLADDYTHSLWPSTMRMPGQARASKETVLANVKTYTDGFVDSFGFDVNHPVNVVEGKNVIVIQMRSHGKLKNGKENNQEMLHIVRFNEHKKVISVDEWVDTAGMMKSFEGGVFPQMGPDGRINNLKEAKKAYGVLD